MTEDDRTDKSDRRNVPVLFVVDADRAERTRIAADLRRRFSPDFRVRTAASAGAGLAALALLADQGADVALVAADLDLPGADGVAFLERARALHPGTVRALLIAMDERGTRLPTGALQALRRAIALGRIEFSIIKGWVSPDEWLYPQVQEALSGWVRAHRPRYEAVRVVGDRWAPRSHELRDILARNTVPFGFYAADAAEGHALLRAYGADPNRLPVVIRQDGRVLPDPSLIEIADALGVRTRPAAGLYDLAILGAGPAGLAAAVYGTSEGLNTVVFEPRALGGQAGTSSMIRNYLGFARGVSGGDLTSRAYEQAMLFGAEFVFMQRARALTSRRNERVIALADGSEVVARAVIIATGVTYRRLGIPAVDRLVGAGVFYGAAGVEAPGMTGQEVYVIGGANSAGQAALHLAKYAARVTLLVRGESLTTSMSDYLITELESTVNIRILLRTRLVDGRGMQRLESLVLEEVGRHAEAPAAGLFVMIGAEPRTDWLGPAVRRDDAGYVLTGIDVPVEAWPAIRSPLPFETSVPGVFAAGDVRHGSVKRVAGAVGEGSVAVGSVHRFLAEHTEATSDKT